MTQNDWRAGRSIDEIRQKLSPTTEQKQEIESEIKKKFQEINLNLAKTEEVELEQNIISVAQKKQQFCKSSKNTPYMF